MKKFYSLFISATILIGLMVASAAAYPNKPVSFVVPWPPGDVEDILTRLIAEEFQSKYGVAAAVLNKPGGGGGPFPGAMEVANAPADGTMIGSFVIAVPVIGPLVGIPGLDETTFEPIGIFLTYPFIIATKKEAPYQTMGALARYAKKNKVALGHYGINLIPTKITFAAAKKLGFTFGSESAFDTLDCNTLASGDADVINTTIQALLPCLDKVKILATITGKRIPIIPDVPTVSEFEPTLNLTLWGGLFVKKGTSQEVKDKVAEAAKSALSKPKALQLAKNTGAEIYWKNAKMAKQQIQSDIVVWKAINQLLK
jgi:tripartite-type tricarboxylate transporter receptor subunit TctC